MSLVSVWPYDWAYVWMVWAVAGQWLVMVDLVNEED